MGSSQTVHGKTCSKASKPCPVWARKLENKLALLDKLFLFKIGEDRNAVPSLILDLGTFHQSPHGAGKKPGPPLSCRHGICHKLYADMNSELILLQKKRGKHNKSKFATKQRKLYLTDPVELGKFYKHLCHWLTGWPFVEISSKYCLSQTSTITARELTFSDNVQPPSCVPCSMSIITCQMSEVEFFLVFFLLKSGGSNWWRVCYQRGIRRLV